MAAWLRWAIRLRSCRSMISDRLGYLTSRLQTPTQSQGRIPNTDTVAGLNRESRKTASEIAKRFRSQIESGIELRRQHSIRWIQTLSIMNGVHYFTIDNYGFYRRLTKMDPNQVWAVVPVLDPFYRWEHGRLSANQLGVTASPVTGNGPAAFYQTKVAQDVMSHWIEEVDLRSFDDEANQQLLTYGMVALFAEKVPHRNQVFVRSFPQCDLMPIPYDARNWQEMDGIMRVITVSKDWLEMQDEMYEQRNGTKPVRKMADKSSAQSAMWHSRFMGFGNNIGAGSKFNGATACWIWMKPTPLNPFGEHLFMIEDELFGYVSGLDQQGNPIALVNGDLPLYPVYYVKKPHDWWGYSFCSGLVPMQLEANRQMSELVQSSQINRGFLGYNSQLVNATDVQNCINGLVPFKNPGPEDRLPPLISVQAANVGKDLGAVLQITDQYAKKAAAYESDILMGQQEGRTDSAGATQILAANANAPLQPVLDRKSVALSNVYRDAYRGIGEVWPEQKRIRVNGIDGFGRERLVMKNMMGSPDAISIAPTPLMVNGRNGFMQLIFSLRQMPGDDGKPIMSAREVRRSLQMLNFSPPGLTLYDPVEQRIKWRINQIINDGMTPAIPDAQHDPQSNQILENHQLAFELLREALLDPVATMYSREVKQSLRNELDFHYQLLHQNITKVDTFDAEADEHLSRIAENALDAAENNPESTAGLFMPAMGV